MSLTEDWDFGPRKRSKRNWLSSISHVFLGCVLKKKSRRESSYANVGCQCGHQLDLPELKCASGSIDMKSETNVDIAIYENELTPLADEFRSSLDRLDSLIFTLNGLRGLCKSSSTSSARITEKDTLSTEEILKFNINFDEKSSIECCTDRGKHSLKIINHSEQYNSNPLILHRCESEYLLTKDAERVDFDNIEFRKWKASSEICCQNYSHIPRTFHPVPGKFGSRFLNMSSFRTSVINHMNDIREDARTLKCILHSIECVLQPDRTPTVPCSFREITKWFLSNRTEVKYDFNHGIAMLMTEDVRYMEAKTRATNFCIFHTLGKKIQNIDQRKEKRKKRKH